ncbi:acyl carrier protein [Streptomyces sp. IBSBF 2435]|uniref:acyl carrier protein n=1 Tax=Streptomyces sp. IBSBF 2435 TaxID=2903531 RepID=UPI002FDC7549
MSGPAVPGRAEIVAILAAFGDRPPDQVPEGIDSMELAWLVHQIEQRYGGTVDDDALVRMSTVSGVLQVLGELRDEPGSDEPGGGGHSETGRDEPGHDGAGAPGPGRERHDHA